MAVSMTGTKFRAWDHDGKPLAFGKVYTYKARTNAPKVSYKSEDGLVDNTNPVILNGEGYADIYLDGSYKIVVKDMDDNEINTTDPVTAHGGEEWVNCMAATYLSSESFKITGNATNKFEVGRRIRIDNNAASYEYSTILSSVFAGGETTVTINSASIATGLMSVCASIVGGNSVIQTQADTVDELRLTEAKFHGQKLNLLGYKVQGIGGGDVYADLLDESGIDNGVTRFLMPGGGCWKRFETETLTPEMAGYLSSDSDGGAALNTLCSVNPGVVVISQSMVMTTVWELISDLKIVFVNGGKLLGTNATVITATDKSNIEVVDLNVDGGATGTVDLSYVRGVRFIRCTDVKLKGLSRVDNPFDWGLSFETCSLPYVESFITSHTYDASVAGGRDGVHFLDCASPRIDRARGRSGDDLVAFTVEYADCTDVQVSDVVGSSIIANVCLLGSEANSTKAFKGVMSIDGVYCDTEGLRVLTIEPPSAGGNEILNISNVGVLEGVQSGGHTIFIQDWDGEISATNLKGDSATQHGIHFLRCGNVVAGNLTGLSANSDFDNINYSSCGDLILSGHRASNSLRAGVAITNCGDVNIDSYKVNNNAIHNLRVTDCGDVIIGDGDGISVGAGTTLAGLRQAGNASISISNAAVFVADVSYNTAPAEFWLQRPIYALKGSDNGTFSVGKEFGGTAVKNSTGDYTVTFATPLANINVMPSFALGAVAGSLAVYANDSTTISFRTFDSSNTLADFAFISFLVHAADD
ncbi:MAG: hypothetical protein RPS47_17400 [Colwellia sp.]